MSNINLNISKTTLELLQAASDTTGLQLEDFIVEVAVRASMKALPSEGADE